MREEDNMSVVEGSSRTRTHASYMFIYHKLCTVPKFRPHTCGSWSKKYTEPQVYLMKLPEDLRTRPIVISSLSHHDGYNMKFTLLAFEAVVYCHIVPFRNSLFTHFRVNLFRRANPPPSFFSHSNQLSKRCLAFPIPVVLMLYVSFHTSLPH